ncbi:N-acetylglucosaminyl-phosphatidylinositol de-N-acetylase [Salminus brasiliensis]|uniref:N-acetylglucosaminyl-phosphatidylinositol de-N-acetylase n=1 Tax=Salminus brasiliensis TaxID=930266 RepID=UPI003B82D440
MQREPFSTRARFPPGLFCEAVEMLVLLCVAVCCLGYFISVKLIYNRVRRTRGFSSLGAYKAADVSTSFRRSGDDHPLDCGGVRALLVTAHPDDECMFFAPSVLKLAQSDASVRLLCLSSGNYYNQGAERREELLASCAVLGIPASQVTIIENKELPDDPNAEWSTALTSMLVLRHIRTHSINLVLTFDEGGVSGHANHVAIYRALSHLASARRIPEGCQVLTLHTVSILRKYLSIFELPISWLFSPSFCCVIGPKEYKRAKEAMLRHRSQLLWFRRLYMLFSRYMFINTFRAVAVETKHVKIY